MPTADQNVQDILHRLTNLEKHNRRLKHAGLALVVLAVGGLMMGQAGSTKTIEAEKIILRDGKGHVRIQLDARCLVPPQGPQDSLVETPSITLYGENLTPKLSLTLEQQGPELRITDEKGFPRTILSQSLLEIRDSAGYRTQLGSGAPEAENSGRAQHMSTASLVFFGKGDKVIWSAP
jgi:hypothetical protein